MTELGTDDYGDNSPERIIEDALWDLGKEKPECRNLIINLIGLLRNNQKALLNGKAEEFELTPEMLEFAEIFSRAYETKRPITVAQCATEAKVSTKTISCITSTTKSFFIHVKSLHPSRRAIAKKSMFTFGEYLSIPKDELETWWNRINAYCDSK